MSLQLIYTSSLRLLDSAQAGYGTVARSEVMPREMRRKLSLLSRYREGSKIAGVQYSYTTMAYAGQEYHVFTACQPAGADYSGRNCFIAHHLVLLPEEVSALRRNDMRPTPAGVLLALTNAGFWRNGWQSEPGFIRNEPHLNREHLPDSSSQSTWKRLTGHKRNAKAFFTPPFERDCLVTAEPGTESTDILRLFHESDCLTPHCGWGKTFTTHADNNDTFRELQRWASSGDSPLVHKAMRTGHAVLPISQELDLTSETQDTASTESGVTEAEFRERLAARRAARMVPAYHYTEEPDAEIYAPSLRTWSTRLKAALLIGSLGLLAGGGGALWYIWQPDKRPTVKVLNPGSAHKRLSELLRQDYDANTTAQMLRDIEQMTATPPYADSVLNKGIAEIVNILEQASEATRHVRHMRRLCSLADEYRLDRHQLCLVYMHEATHNRPVEDWLQSFSREELQEWESLISDEPALRQTLSHPKLLAYFDRVMDSTKIDETSQQTSGDRQTQGEQLHALTVDDELPPSLMQLLNNTPQTIANGTVRLVPITKGEGSAKQSCDIALAPALYALKIEASEQVGRYLLRFVNPKGPGSIPLAEIILEVRDNRLHSITHNGTPIAADIPLDSSGRVILVPRLAIPLSGIHPPPLPDIESSAFRLEPEDIRILPASAEHMSTQLQLTPLAMQRFPREPEATQINKQQFSFSLPKLQRKNSIAPPEVSASSPLTVRWNGASLTGETGDFATFTCAVTPSSPLRERLSETFNRVANQCCAGEVSEGDPMYSLAMAYTTISILSREGLSDKEKNSAGTRYCTLFANKKFSELMQKVLPNHPELQLSYETATSRSASSRTKRRQLMKRLEREDERAVICRGIRDYLSSALLSTYKTEQEQAARDIGMQMVLKQIRLHEKGGLVWHFIFRPLSTKDTSS